MSVKSEKQAQNGMSRRQFVGATLAAYGVGVLQDNRLIEMYGEEKGTKVKYVEAFEICEYGRRPSKEAIKRLFPFYDWKRNT